MLKNTPCLFVLLLLILSNPFASKAILPQQIQETEADSLIQLADSLTFQLGEFQTARSIYETLLSGSSFHKSKDYYGVLGNLSWCQWQMGDYELSIKTSDSVLNMGSEKAKEYVYAYSFALSSQGICYSFLGDFEKSKALFTERIELILSETPDDYSRISTAYSHLATAYTQIGDLSGSISSYEQSLTYIEKTTESFQKTSQLASTQQNIAWTYSLLKNFRLAEKNFNLSIENYKKIVPKDHPSLGDLYLSMGGFYFEEFKYQQSLDCMYESLSIYKKKYGYGHFRVVKALTNIGTIFTNLTEYDSAKHYFGLAINGAKEGIKNSSAFDEMLALSYLNLGNLSVGLMEFDDAENYLDSANRFRIQTDPRFLTSLLFEQANLHEKAKNPARMVKLLDQLTKKLDTEETSTSDLANLHAYYAKYHKLIGQSDSAFIYIDQAIDLYRNEGKEFAVVNYDLVDYLLYKSELLADGIKSEQVSDLTSFKTSIKEGLGAANDLFDLNSFYDEDQHISKFVKRMTSLGFSMISHQKNIGQQTDLAFVSFLMDNSKSQKLKSLNGYLSDNSLVEDSLIIMLNDARAAVTYHQNALLESKKEKQENVRKELLEARINLKSAWNRIKEDKSYASRITDIAQNDQSRNKRDKKLNEYQLIVEYFYTPEKVYATARSSGQFSFFEIPADNNFNAAVIAYSGSLKGFEQKLKQGSLLYESLLSEILNTQTDEIKELVIIPDGALWNLNFDLLLTENINDENKKNIPYLLKKYSISYAYSTALSLNKGVTNLNVKKELLAFSYGKTNENYGEKISLKTLRSREKDLPGSRSEVREIAEIIDGDVYYGDFASEQRFKSVAKEYQILHLAIQSKPELSKLDFYAKGDSIEDGRLHAFELFSMNLNADLAVLSACNTGSGKVVDGEGVMSLGRAFSYAGVNSLLLTRWDVTDATAPEIMSVFYRELKKGKRKSEALRIAKLEFLSNSNNITSDPYYWGSFYLLGDDSSIELNDNFTGLYYIFAGIVLAFLLIAYIIRRKTRISH